MAASQSKGTKGTIETSNEGGTLHHAGYRLLRFSSGLWAGSTGPSVQAQILLDRPLDIIRQLLLLRRLYSVLKTSLPFRFDSIPHSSFLFCSIKPHHSALFLDIVRSFILCGFPTYGSHPVPYIPFFGTTTPLHALIHCTEHRSSYVQSGPLSSHSFSYDLYPALTRYTSLVDRRISIYLSIFEFCGRPRGISKLDIHSDQTNKSQRIF